MMNVVDYLENSINIYKNKIAVIEEDKKITYESLGYLSKCVGSYIGKNHFNEPIIVFMDKGIDTLITFLGTVYAGCFYTLINPDLPEARINQIKEVINSKLVITNEDYFTLASSYFKDCEVKLISDLKEAKINEDVLLNAYQNHLDVDPLYVNFTSGSTGTPKGVVISHRSVIDFIDHFTNIFAFKQSDVIANQAPFDFDVSVKDIYSSLKVGATLVIVPKKYFSSPASLLDYLCDNKVTTLTWAVSALCLITTFHGLDYKVPTTIEKVLFSGEVMPIKHLKMWMEKLPQTTFVNLYGPTEITCNCLYYVIDRNKEYDSIPIGRPFPNERVFLLDDKGNIIKSKSTIGEVCVSGTCVGLGYYNNEEVTNKNFVLNNKNYLELIYKTGDLAYLDEDDNYVFVGRKDFQIKYQGHRIELEEIDKAVMNIEGVIRSCTIFDSEKERLYTFFVGDLDKDIITSNLRKVLPTYMIPSKIIKVDVMPLTKNGKIDRSKLKEGVK